MSSDIELEPDLIVRTALQRLPIPSHADGFWTRLEGALDAEQAASAPARPDERTVLVALPDDAPGAAADTSPAAPELDGDPALALVPRSMRRTSNGVLVAVAAATVLVVALASTSLLEEGDGTKDGGSGGTAQASVALDALVSESQPASVTPSTMSSDGAAASSDAVLAWVDDIGTGDGPSAWKAMGPASQAHFGTQEAFEAEMTSIADDYGAWSDAAPDDVLVTPVLASDEGTLAVVTLVGIVAQAGTTERRADAFPVRLVDGEAILEPFALAGELEVVVPEPMSADGVRPPVGAGEELVIVVPTDAKAPVLRLDDGDAVVCGQAEGTELTNLDGSPGQRCSYLPPEGIEPGEHTFTMAFLGSDGDSISAESLLFDAA